MQPVRTSPWRRLALTAAASLAPLAAQGASDVVASDDGARLLRQQDKLGSLAPGKFADIIVTRENPLDDIRALKRLALVMRGGVAHLNALS